MEETQLRNLESDVHQADVPLDSSWFPPTDAGWSHPGQSLMGGPPSRTASNPVVPRRFSTAEPQNQRKRSHPLSLSNSIATANLQNPSDAIDILAQVANHTEDAEPSESEAEGSQNEIPSSRSATIFAHPQRSLRDSSMMEFSFDYKPVMDGLISYETVFELFTRFVRVLCRPYAISANPLKL
jgi:hypothetical protein